MIKQLSRVALICAIFAAGESVAALRYVNPNHGSAQDAGAGAATQPYRTLTYAMKQIRPGDTLYIAPATYRESIIFPNLDWSGGAATVIQSSGGEVMIKGSDVITGWQAVKPGLFVKRNWTVNSEQVFVDGAAMKQIGGTIYGDYPLNPNHPLAKLHASQGGIWLGRIPGGIDQMTDNSFYYDQANKSLYVKVPYTTLAGHNVEVSVRPQLVFGQKLQNVTLRNLRFQHSNTTSMNQTGAVTLLGNRLVLDGISVTYCDGAGYDVTGDENLIKNSKGNYCGQLGMKVRGRANKLIDNETSHNNTRRFNKWWEAGGAKFVGNGGLRDSELTGHRSIANNADGIWFDWNNSNNKIHNNVSAYNTGFGIHYEASQKAYIYDNYVFSNGQRGIYLLDSADSVIAFNLVADHPLEGIAIIEDSRSKDNPAFIPARNRVVGNIIGWSMKPTIVLPTGLQQNVSDYNVVLAWGPRPTFSIGWSPLYTGLEAWRPASGQDVHSWGRQVQIPATLWAALEGEQASPDWSPILSAANGYTVNSAALGATGLAVIGNHSVPGPRR